MFAHSGINMGLHVTKTIVDTSHPTHTEVCIFDVNSGLIELLKFTLL